MAQSLVELNLKDDKEHLCLVFFICLILSRTSCMRTCLTLFLGKIYSLIYSLSEYLLSYYLSDSVEYRKSPCSRGLSGLVGEVDNR